MRLVSVELLSFRCWKELSVTFPEGATALVGPNGSGKTSVVEGAWYAASLGSHRSSADQALIHRDADAAIVRAVAHHDGRDDKVELEIRRTGRARARRGGAPVPRRRDVLGALKAQIFAPERQELVRGDPGDRRRFADEVLVQLHPRYHAAIKEYERALRQRNALLKEALKRGRPPHGIEVWDAAVSNAGAEISHGRADAIARLAPHAARLFLAAGGSGSLEVAYEPNVPSPGDLAGVADWAASFRERIEERRRDEAVRGISLVGPHRDEIRLTIDGLVCRQHASFGEGWMVAIALVLGAQAAVAEATGVEPVLLLDDPFTPLDPGRRELLAEALPPEAQVIVTAADPAEVPKALGATLLRASSEGVSADGA